MGSATSAELAAVSAGFDAADGDILGECCVTPAGYAHMTYMLSTLAGGKVVVALEVSLSLKRCFFSYGCRVDTRSNRSPTVHWL
jgi:acetoin utilization deacetylase AcuC-like enzyme